MRRHEPPGVAGAKDGSPIRIRIRIRSGSSPSHSPSAAPRLMVTLGLDRLPVPGQATCASRAASGPAQDYPRNGQNSWSTRWVPSETGPTTRGPPGAAPAEPPAAGAALDGAASWGCGASLGRPYSGSRTDARSPGRPRLASLLRGSMGAGAAAPENRLSRGLCECSGARGFGCWGHGLRSVCRR